MRSVTFVQRFGMRFKVGCQRFQSFRKTVPHAEFCIQRMERAVHHGCSESLQIRPRARLAELRVGGDDNLAKLRQEDVLGEFVDRRLWVIGRDVGLAHLLSNLFGRIVKEECAVGVGF